jgi:branched-chain amino acid aminotransferase
VQNLKSEITNDYIIHNGLPLKAEELDSKRLLEFPGVYEVIRVIDGIPLFWEKHIERFRSSANLINFIIQFSSQDLRKFMRKLMEINNCRAGNVKIVINNHEKDGQDSYTFFIHSKYPSKTEIQYGVPSILYYGERSNPNAKTTDLTFREGVTAQVEAKKAYEALLVNKENEVTEGSKSNIFLVKGREVFTPPLKSVLPGVTRGFVIDICRDLGLAVHEAAIGIHMLEDIDGLFMTGTSPQVLPLSSVDNLKFESASNPVISEIRISYEKLVMEYIESHKENGL